MSVTHTNGTQTGHTPFDGITEKNFELQATKYLTKIAQIVLLITFFSAYL